MGSKHRPGLCSQGSHTSNSRSKASKSSPGKYRASHHFKRQLAQGEHVKLSNFCLPTKKRFLTSTIY